MEKRKFTKMPQFYKECAKYLTKYLNCEGTLASLLSGPSSVKNLVSS